MITMELNEHSAEDFKDIQVLKSAGLSDEEIQKIYDRTQERRKENAENDI